MDKIATWASKHSVQKTSGVAFMSKYCQYAVYQQNFADITLRQHRKIHWSNSNLKRRCGFLPFHDRSLFSRLDVPLAVTNPFLHMTKKT